MNSKVRRRDFLKTIGLGAAAVGTNLSATAAPEKRRAAGQAPKRPRNILFLMTDQHRFNAMGHAGDPYAVTPHLDGLAATGAYLRRTYCQNPVCVPSRNSILLGRYSHSTGVRTNGNRSPRDQASFTQVMRENGFRTACFGKLHVLGRDDLDWDVLNPKREWPPRKMIPGRPTMHTSRFQGGQPLGQPAPFNLESHREWRAKEQTIEFMKANRDRRWFIQCSLPKPHPAFQPPQRHWDRIDRSKLVIPRYPKNDLDDVNPKHWQSMIQRKVDDLTDDQVLDAMQGYYGNIAFCDDMFGEVLAALDALGLREDTLILFTADHGEMLYDHRLWTKFTFFEQSVCVPLMFSWPGQVAGGRVTDALVEHIDLFPTLMDFLGIETPASVQGRSLVPLLAKKTDKHRDAVHSEHEANLGMVMQFDGRYKYIDNGPGVTPELYDLKTDPREITNLAMQADHKDRMAAKSAEMRQWQKRDAVAPAPRKGGRRQQKRKRA